MWNIPDGAVGEYARLVDGASKVCGVSPVMRREEAREADDEGARFYGNAIFHIDPVFEGEGVKG